jgi:hypothetical protein
MEYNPPLVIILYVLEFITAGEAYKANFTDAHEGIYRLATPEAESD